jgi:hypothetical protein
LGADSSGEGNNFTVTNLVATDQMVDTPTNNWCTLNPLDIESGASLSEGNLEMTSGVSDNGGCRGTIFAGPAGKWYWEFYVENADAGAALGAGGPNLTIRQAGFQSNSYAYWGTNGYKQNNNSQVSYGDTYTAGDIIGVALDLDASPGTITFYKNNATQGVAYSNLTDGNVYAPQSGEQSGIATSVILLNAGQDSSFAGNLTAQGWQDANDVGDFYYEPPANHLALCVDNIGSASASTFSYVGTGNADGPFVYMGYAPSSITISSVTYDIPTAGNPSDSLDWLANGIKIRSSSVRNTDSTTYDITAAPIEQDFKHGNAR